MRPKQGEQSRYRALHGKWFVHAQFLLGLAALVREIRPQGERIGARPHPSPRVLNGEKEVPATCVPQSATSVEERSRGCKEP